MYREDSGQIQCSNIVSKYLCMNVIDRRYTAFWRMGLRKFRGGGGMYLPFFGKTSEDIG